MKYLLLIAIFYSCNGMYPKEKENKIIAPMGVDSVVFEGAGVHVFDTTSISTRIYNCLFKVKNPYDLIQWNDSTYGILYRSNTGHLFLFRKDFTQRTEFGEHFKDSCEAKEDLQQYLDTKITYKIVK